MIDVPYLPANPDAADNYSGRYVAAGVLLLVVAAMCGCITALMPVSIVMQARMANQAYPPGTQQPPAMPMSQFVMAIAMYGLVMIGAAWLGIGALQKRRWVRPLVLIFSTHGLIIGVASILGFLLMMPLISGQMRQANPSMGNAAIIGLLIGAIFFLVPAIGFPLTLLLLMKNDAVRMTAERYDLQPRWTDGVPIKVLGLVVTLGILALFELMILVHPAIPAVWTMVTGWAAVPIVLGHIAVLAWAMLHVYRRDLRGWRVALAAVMLPVFVGLPTSLLLPMDRYLQYLADTGVGPDAARMMTDHEIGFRVTWAIFAAVFGIAFVIYMMRLKPLIEVTPVPSSSP